MSYENAPAANHVARRRAGTAILFVIAVTAAFFAGFAVRGSGPAPSADPSAGHATGATEPEVFRLDAATERRIGLRLASAEVRTLRQTIQATGTVGPDETRVAHIRALARGRVDSVHVRLGDRVGAGQRLLSYDNADLGEAIGQYLSALADLEKARSEAEVAKRTLDRTKNLVKLGAAARADHDHRDAEYRNSLATVERCKAEAAKEEEKLHRFGMTDEEIARLGPQADSQYHRESSHTAITAPFAGIITKLDAVPGEPISPDDVLLILLDLGTVWVQSDVYEKDIAAVRAGAPAEVSVEAYPGRTFAGKVTYISASLDPRTRSAKVRCEVPNLHGLLKLEMFATVRIPAPAVRQAVVIPLDAVQQIDQVPLGFVKTGEGEFHMRMFRLGERSDGWIEALDGVRAGEQVVTEGSFILKSEAMKADLGRHGH